MAARKLRLIDVINNYGFMFYEEREKQKKEAMTKIYKGTNLSEKLQGVDMLAEAYYYRSLEHSRDLKRQHPGRQEFSCHLLANCEKDYADAELVEIIKQKYPRPAKPNNYCSISSYWHK